jgi:hypothetical protein
LREKFDVKKANERFKELEGLPYGIHAFLFGWIDTPFKNTPKVVHSSLMPMAFEMMSYIMPETVEHLFTKAINQRFGIKDKSIL